MNGNSSQTTSSQQPIANGSAILASTSVPNGIGRPNPPLLFTNFKKKWLSIFKYWVKFTVALLIYGATLYIAWSASKRHTLLGLASPQLGIWILSIFAKAGDITFAFAVQDTFDIFAWRKLKQRQGVSGPENFGGIKLVWFLSMVSSTGVLGLIRILWRTVIKSVFINVFRVVFRKKKARQQAGGLLGPNPNGHISEKRTWRQWWKNGAFARWSFIRLLFIVILIPGSGIILMADISQKNVFFDVRDMNVSAGIAEYDPTIATAYHTIFGPVVSKTIEGMLQDRSLSWPMDPITPDCKKNSTCKSYLLAGPSNTVAPWPFTHENTSIGGFQVRNAPYYQVDLWNPDPSLAFNESTDCTLYGGFNATTEYSTVICISEPQSNGILAAGWLTCQKGYSRENGTCLEPGNLAGWATYLRYYRRTATLVFSRTDLTIESVTDLGMPMPQTISPDALFQSLNAVLYRPNRTENDFQYDFKSSQYVLTQSIGYQLWASLYARAGSVTIAQRWLRNMLTMPVYLFQPTFYALEVNMNPNPQENGTLVVPNLPAENYVLGSYGVVDRRAIPGRGTVYAYTAVAGLLLACVLAAKLRAWRWEEVNMSEFPALDFEALTEVVGEDGRTRLDLKARFDGLGKEYGTGSVLDDIQDLRIGLRRP